MAERVRITVDSGGVSVVGEARKDIEVDGESLPSEDGEVVLRGGSDALVVRVPAGTDVLVGSSSGDIELEGPLGAVSVTTSSADVRAEDVASIDARTVSGKLRVGQCRGPMRLKTKSGRIRVGRVDGEAHVSTISGRLEIASASAGVSITTVSANIEVHVAGREPVRVETVSGNINVILPDGVRPTVHHRSTSGRLRVDPETGDDLVIDARSISGNVGVRVAR